MVVPLIEVNNLKKSFGKHVVLENVDLNINKNEILCIIGTNGSGKTTLLKTMIGFYKPDSGNVIYKGSDVRKNVTNVRNDFGFATQENAFYHELKVKENLEYFGKLYGLTKEEIRINTDHLLKIVRLSDVEDMLAGHLSTGMQRRLDIACSLIHNPRVLILDEPTEDLDVSLRKEILQLILAIKKTGTTIIMTSHLLSEVEEICDRIAILYDKNIIKTGTLKQLKDIYAKHEYIILETVKRKYTSIVARLRGCKIKKYGNSIIISSDDTEETLYKILNTVKRSRDEIINLDIKKPSLNEIFEIVTKNA